MNIIHRDTNPESNKIHKKHLDNLQRVFDILKEKFQGENMIKMVNIDGDLIKDLDDMIKESEEG